MAKKGYATQAKIRAVYGKCLTSENYHELLRCSDVTDAAEYLKRSTHYGKTLAQIDTNTIHRGMLEVLIRRNRFEEYKRLCKFEQLFESGIEFYRYVIVESEVTEILSLMRHINAGSGDDYISTMPSYMNEYSSFDYIALAKIRDYGELLEFLKPTPYYAVLKDFIPSAGVKPKFTDIEVALRTYYFKWLLAAIRKAADKESADEIEKQIKIQIDFMNIINSYRMKKFFGMSAADIEKDMLPFYGRLSQAKQYELYSAPDGDSFISRFSKTVYGRQMAENGIDTNDLEMSVRRMRYRYAKAVMCRSIDTSSCLYAFMYLLETEVNNIISIIEGIRYQADPKRIESLIVI
ncbi:MAG: V-type ATPase subunit [Ruminococcus sp.]|nr:V-type ATPase subunit [Ruminococcus sp.]